MNVKELGLSASAESKLGQLAMAVEVHCKQRFSIRKDVMDVAALLVVAETSEHQVVLMRRREFMDALSVSARTLLLSMIGAEPVESQRRYPGVGVVTEAVGFVGRVMTGGLYRGNRQQQELLDAVYAANDPRNLRMYRGQLAR